MRNNRSSAGTKRSPIEESGERKSCAQLLIRAALRSLIKAILQRFALRFYRAIKIWLIFPKNSWSQTGSRTTASKQECNARSMASRVSQSVLSFAFCASPFKRYMPPGATAVFARERPCSLKSGASCTIPAKQSLMIAL